MNVLAMGLPMWVDRAGLAPYRSARGHAVRLLGIEGDADCRFAPDETAAAVIARVARTWRPDLLLCGCPELYPPPLSVELCPIPTVAIVSDWNVYGPQLTHNLARFDRVLADRRGARLLDAPGARIEDGSPLYAHRPGIHRGLGLARDLDIVFLGNLNHGVHRARGRVLEAAAALSDRYRVLIDGGYDAATYAALMNRARIVVNHALRGEMNLRCFEAPACGALLFVEAANEEAGDWLRDGAEAVFYAPETLAAQLVQWLEDEPARARAAAAGQARIAALAPEHRLDALFDRLEAGLAGGPGPRACSAPDAEGRGLAEVLWYGSSRVAAQRDWAHARIAALRAAAPDRAVWRLAEGCAALDRAAASADAVRRGAVRAAVTLLHTAAEAAPGEAVPWLDLAFVARRAGQAVLERHCLERACDAGGTQWPGLLLGDNFDPYYTDWRLACAVGGAVASLLHAGAWARRAALHLAQGDAAAALAMAAESLARKADVALPYRVAADAHAARGEWEAAWAMLEAGRPYTAFDVDYRRQMLAVLGRLGRQAEAQALARATATLLRGYPSRSECAAEFEAW